jgi:hypothetical protein
MVIISAVEISLVKHEQISLRSYIEAIKYETEPAFSGTINCGMYSTVVDTYLHSNSLLIGDAEYHTSYLEVAWYWYKSGMRWVRVFF